MVLTVFLVVILTSPMHGQAATLTQVGLMFAVVVASAVYLLTVRHTPSPDKQLAEAGKAAVAAEDPEVIERRPVAKMTATARQPTDSPSEARPQAKKGWDGRIFLALVAVVVLVGAEWANRSEMNDGATSLVQEQLDKMGLSSKWRITTVNLPDITVLEGESTAKVVIANDSDARTIQVDFLGRCLFGCSASVRNLYFLGLE